MVKEISTKDRWQPGHGCEMAPVPRDVTPELRIQTSRRAYSFLKQFATIFNSKKLTHVAELATSSGRTLPPTYTRWIATV